MATYTSNPFSVSVVAAGSVTVDYPIAAYGQSAILFTVRIPTASGSDTNFTYTTQNSGTGDDYAAAGTDYTTTSGTGTITAGNLYTQISVPIAGNTPPNGRHEFEFSINSGAVVSTGLIMNGLYMHDFDYPSVAASQKQNWQRSDQTGAWENYNLKPISTASITSEVPAATGVNCLKHNMLTSTGSQSSIGTDSLSTIRVGDIFDGLDYYYRIWMRIEPGFIWNGSLQDKMKSGRLVRIVGTPNYCTTYIQGDKWYWTRTYPTSGNSELQLLYDFASMDDGEWHEVIIHQKRESAYEASDGEARLIIDGVVVASLLNTDWTEIGEIEPGDASSDDVRITNMGLWGFMQNQIGVNGETTGGVIYTDGFVGTQGIWPSPIYTRPW